MSFTNPYPASRLTLDATASINSGLQGFWALTDGSGSTAKDITANANDGTQSGGVSWASTAIGTAASFDGVDDYFTASTPTLTQPASISAWFKTTDNTGYIIDGDDASDRLAVFFYANSLYYFAGSVGRTIGAANEYNDGEWHHVVVTFDATENAYVDGVLKTSLADGSNQLTGVVIGARYSLNENLGGDIQNVRIYNRALSATEVATLYNRPWEGTNYGTLWPYSPPAPADATLSTDTASTSLNVDLEGWWLTTDNTGTMLVDISGNGRDATLTGTNSWVADSVGTVNRFDNSSRTSHAETANTQPDLSGGYTFSAWVKHEEAGASGSLNYYGAGIVLGNSSGSSDLEIYWNARNVSSQYPQIVHNRSNGGTLDAVQGTSSTKSNDNGVWVHETVTMDGTTFRVYRNGVQVLSSGVTTAPLSTPGYKLYINELPVVSASAGLTCSMQNIRLYSRALSADEVTLLYERPFEGIEYGDAFHYDPPTPANLTPLTSDSINNSQIGWWPLTETDDYASGAADISGNANNGTQSGGVLSDVSRLGGVASFDGSNDYIDCTAISQGTAGSFTVSAWCNPDTASKDQRFFTKWNVGAGGTAPDLFNIWYDIGGANVGYAFAVKDASLSQTIVGADTASGGVGVWSHVVGVYDSTGPTMTLYVDGVQIASGAATGPIAWNTNNSQSPVRIGAILSERADGLVQNCRLWTRVLSSDEVWSIYSNPWLGSAYQASAAAAFRYLINGFKNPLIGGGLVR